MYFYIYHNKRTHEERRIRKNKNNRESITGI